MITFLRYLHVSPGTRLCADALRRTGGEDPALATRAAKDLVWRGETDAMFFCNYLQIAFVACSGLDAKCLSKAMKAKIFRHSA